ncbi:hypothetical protein L6452_01601 [Arctium lappa]|uniref:Uncharacterized protein n=1 Tax=Arctium lappa TaxID=4217 RepID=A0ACB9FHC5_ARCLA|nr:hypothetical protein L6452_01601 [Arctium lappa]
MMRDARRFAQGRALDIDGVQFDRRDYTILAVHPPDWIRSEFWIQMIEQVWNTDGFRRVCAANTANRATEYVGMTSRHCTGSISTTMHRDRMDAYHHIREKDYPDLPPNDAELWERSVGGRRKGRIFGWGTSQDLYYAMTGDSVGGVEADVRERGSRENPVVGASTERESREDPDAGANG